MLSITESFGEALEAVNKRIRPGSAKTRVLQSRGYTPIRKLRPSKCCRPGSIRVGTLRTPLHLCLSAACLGV